MSISISNSPNEDPEVIKRLLKANLFDVFGQRDTAARSTTVSATYHNDVVWYEPDRVVQGLKDLDARAGEILDGAPGFSFITDGQAIVTQNIGVLSWKFGPSTDPELVKGTDVILVEGGKIKALWTAVTKLPGS